MGILMLRYQSDAWKLILKVVLQNSPPGLHPFWKLPYVPNVPRVFPAVRKLWLMQIRHFYPLAQKIFT
eukprot:12401596-Karenia_brevis.AAC.1